MEIEIIEKKHKIAFGEYEIQATTNAFGQISCKTDKGSLCFEFEKSEPETLEAIGLLLIEASKLVKGVQE